MITCKEDLINTYIENDHGELRDLYLSKCEYFGFLSNSGRKPTEMAESSAPYFGMTETDGALSYSTNWSFADNGCKKLTLSDLKPRTKVEYELIKFESTAGAYRAMLDGEKLYSQDGESEFLFDGKNFVGIDIDGGVYTLECHSNNEPFYRKVERPVEWWDDVVEFIVENDDDDLSAYFDKQSGNLRVNTNLPRDKWCDFARILLEQEGE